MAKFQKQVKWCASRADGGGAGFACEESRRKIKRWARKRITADMTIQEIGRLIFDAGLSNSGDYIHNIATELYFEMN